MKTNLYVLMISVLISTQSFAAENLSQLDILKGCWGTVDEDGNKITEDWFKGTSETVVGVSQTKDKNNSMVEHGFLDVSWDAVNSKAVLTATFPGHSTNTFTLSEAKEQQELVFSALNSPVLNKIIYTMKSKDNLVVRYIGIAGGNAFDFSNDFSRENCEARF